MLSSFSLIVSGRMEYNIAETTDLNDNFNSKNDKTDKEDLNPSISIGVLKNINILWHWCSLKLLILKHALLFYIKFSFSNFSDNQ